MGSEPYRRPGMALFARKSRCQKQERCCRYCEKFRQPGTRKLPRKKVIQSRCRWWYKVFEGAASGSNTVPWETGPGSNLWPNRRCGLPDGWAISPLKLSAPLASRFDSTSSPSAIVRLAKSIKARWSGHSRRMWRKFTCKPTAGANLPSQDLQPKQRGYRDAASCISKMFIADR